MADKEEFGIAAPVVVKAKDFDNPKSGSAAEKGFASGGGEPSAQFRAFNPQGRDTGNPKG
jgi:hypothetical protein